MTSRRENGRVVVVGEGGGDVFLFFPLLLLPRLTIPSLSTTVIAPVVQKYKKEKIKD